MSYWPPRTRRGRILLVVGLAAAFLAVCALGIYAAIEVWHTLDRATPAPGARADFYFYAGLVVPTALALCIYVAQDQGKTAPRDAAATVLLAVVGLGFCLYLLLHPSYYWPRLYGHKYTCGSWMSPSLWTLNSNISHYCVASLGASFRWTCLIAAAGVILPVLYVLWQLTSEGVRDKWQSLTTGSRDP